MLRGWVLGLRVLAGASASAPAPWVTDAYAGLAWLASRGEIDPKRVVLTGFSYGGMSTMYALQAQIAERLAPTGLRFAGHVAFYGPCITRWEDKRTTGAPLLMLYGS